MVKKTGKLSRRIMMITFILFIVGNVSSAAADQEVKAELFKHTHLKITVMNPD